VITFDLINGRVLAVNAHRVTSATEGVSGKVDIHTVDGKMYTVEEDLPTVIQRVHSVVRDGT